MMTRPTLSFDRFSLPLLFPLLSLSPHPPLSPPPPPPPIPQFLYLYHFLLLYKGRTLVFVNSISTLQKLRSLLELLQLHPLPLHARMQQRQRLKNFDRWVKYLFSKLCLFFSLHGLKEVIHLFAHFLTGINNFHSMLNRVIMPPISVAGPGGFLGFRGAPLFVVLCACAVETFWTAEPPPPPPPPFKILDPPL